MADENKPDSSNDFSTSTSSSSSSAAASAAVSGRRSLSDALPSRPGHRRSGSGAIFYPTSTSATSSTSAALPAGNICPSGKIGRSRSSSTSKNDILRTGSGGNYGHGSVIRGGNGGGGGGGGAQLDSVEEVKRVGNEMYRKGRYEEALRMYEKAIGMCPENAVCRTNRAAALAAVGRVAEAVRECEMALRIDQGCLRAHQRLGALYLRLGQMENAQTHLFLHSNHPDAAELQKIQSVENHLERCLNARKIGDWKSALREADAAIAAGADSSPLIISSRAESLLRLHLLDEADSVISNASKLDRLSMSCSPSKFFGMLSNSYMHLVHAQVEMALGRFENAVASAEKAKQIDPKSVEIAKVCSNVKLVSSARFQGNELFNKGKFVEACIAYGEGLRYDPSNPVLHCNRAACKSKLRQWEKAIEDCNEALKIKPNYTKALLRRAESYSKLERWVESVKDYEVLRNELPGDGKVAEALFHAQVALKASRGEAISNMKFGGEVELISGLDQFHAAINLPGVSVVHFMVASNMHCIEITPFFDMLCSRYPSVNFHKVDVNESPDVCKAENVKAVPTFKIYKNEIRVKEMICPSHQMLEFSIRHYGV